MAACEMGLETEQTSVKSDAVIAAWILAVIPPQNILQIATQIVVTKGAQLRSQSTRHVTCQRHASRGERPHLFRRGTTPCSRHRGRSHHGLLTISDAVVRLRAAY